MKLKTQEKIRQIELDCYVILILVSILLTRNLECIQKINIFLENSGINLNDVRSAISSILSIDVVSAYRREQYTSEYKELRSLYNKVLQNITNLLKEFNLKEPVSIFVLYMYMYRSGYLSNDKHFVYSVKMKDFSCLNGLDVIRGEGVCRSISSLLTDIYKEMNLVSHNVLVRARSNSFDNIDELCGVTLNKTEKGNKFDKFVGDLTSVLPLANHLITDVEYEGKNYILDPTNDVYLRVEKGKLILPNNKYWKESYLTSIITTSVGQVNTNLNFINKYKQYNLPIMSYDEYRKIYLQVLNLIKNNIDVLEKFYLDNKDVYSEIKELSDKQNNLIKRLFPII